MKIQTADQLKIYKGEISPVDNTLRDLVAHIMLQQAFSINDLGYSNTITPEAESYVSKMNSAVKQIIEFSPAVLNKIYRYTVIAISEEFTISIISALTTDSEWVTKINVIRLRVIELVAQVTLEEKTAYDNPVT